ncbi:AraC family transcriptional regulator [Alcanivorax hongdengensis A-11-3]|uniref:AraC family transcriptional regulator n=1 Tax=Alcanivorax hongdengensis A-11-3 TaxID=1177179 RepID=L0WIR3_9GAMM|nr:AraC family transcriptional regulator [Alcanivorax hongdengensis]EKF76057.1 AraC family transcriptional regulator [Alcanivorax hongdengensis A-11-3]
MSQPQTDRLRPAIHPTYSRLLCAHLQQLGFDNATIFAGTRLHWEQLLSEHRYLSLEQLGRLIHRAVDLTGQPWIGLDIGGMTAVSAHGSLGYAVVSAPDVRTVLEVVTRYVGVRLRLTEIALEETDSGVALVLHERMDLAETREFIHGGLLATYFQLVDTVSSRRLRDARVSLPFEAPPWAAVYEERLGCPVTFGAPRFRIELSAATLATPCLTADPALHRTAVRDCEHQLRQLQGGGPLSQQIGNCLLESTDYPSLEAMADRFAMSRRTLIRKLKAEGTSYQELLDEVRRELAAWYLLETHEPIERVAERLGYQDTSNFSRTFRRWFGVTPLAMRNRAS